MAFFIVTFDNGQELPINADSAEAALAHANSADVRMGTEEVRVGDRVAKRLVIEAGAKPLTAVETDKYRHRRLSAINEQLRQLALEADTLKPRV